MCTRTHPWTHRRINKWPHWKAILAHWRHATVPGRSKPLLGMRGNHLRTAGARQSNLVGENRRPGTGAVRRLVLRRQAHRAARSLRISCRHEARLAHHGVRGRLRNRLLRRRRPHVRSRHAWREESVRRRRAHASWPRRHAISGLQTDRTWRRIRPMHAICHEPRIDIAIIFMKHLCLWRMLIRISSLRSCTIKIPKYAPPGLKKTRLFA